MTLTTSAWKVRSTHRKSGKTQVLDPNFLSRAAAMTFLERLEAKYGGWYSYEAVDLEAEAAMDAIGEPVQSYRQPRQEALGRIGAAPAALRGLQGLFSASESRS